MVSEVVEHHVEVNLQMLIDKTLAHYLSAFVFTLEIKCNRTNSTLNYQSINKRNSNQRLKNYILEGIGQLLKKNPRGFNLNQKKIIIIHLKIIV